MSTLAIRFDPTAIHVEVTSTALRVCLSDGRELAAPIEWFPRLRDASAAARQNWKLIGKGAGIHWPDVDEDISVAGLMTDGSIHAPRSAAGKAVATKKTAPRTGKQKPTKTAAKKVAKKMIAKRSALHRAGTG